MTWGHSEEPQPMLPSVPNIHHSFNYNVPFIYLDMPV